MPLEEDSPVDDLGKSLKDALIVVVPHIAEEFSKLPLDSFKESLKKGKLSIDSEPVQKVLSKIMTVFPLQMLAAAGDVDACISLYYQVKSYPENTTCGAIQDQMNLSINGPISPKILTGLDRDTGYRYMIKLLRPDDMVINSPDDYIKASIDAEVEACNLVNKSDCDCLVKCEVVMINVEYTKGLEISTGEHTALKMRHYFSSLDKVPQMSEKLLFQGFERMVQALESMHSLGLVHMDVKPDNVFCNDKTVWFLGDFGSARKIGTEVWSFTGVFNPYRLTHFKTIAIKSMDYVLLCVLIAVELLKEKWKTRLCGDEQCVQPELILKSFSGIQNVDFLNKITSMFKEHYGLVMEHLQSK